MIKLISNINLPSIVIIQRVIVSSSTRRLLQDTVLQLRTTTTSKSSIIYIQTIKHNIKQHHQKLTIFLQFNFYEKLKKVIM